MNEPLDAYGNYWSPTPNTIYTGEIAPNSSFDNITYCIHQMMDTESINLGITIYNMGRPVDYVYEYSITPISVFPSKVTFNSNVVSSPDMTGSFNKYIYIDCLNKQDLKTIDRYKTWEEIRANISKIESITKYEPPHPHIDFLYYKVKAKWRSFIAPFYTSESVTTTDPITGLVTTVNSVIDSATGVVADMNKVIVDPVLATSTTILFNAATLLPIKETTTSVDPLTSITTDVEKILDSTGKVISTTVYKKDATNIVKAIRETLDSTGIILTSDVMEITKDVVTGSSNIISTKYVYDPNAPIIVPPVEVISVVDPLVISDPLIPVDPVVVPPVEVIPVIPVEPAPAIPPPAKGVIVSTSKITVDMVAMLITEVLTDITTLAETTITTPIVPPFKIPTYVFPTATTVVDPSQYSSLESEAIFGIMIVYNHDVGRDTLINLTEAIKLLNK